jgi:hypothetical protein
MAGVSVASEGPGMKKLDPGPTPWAEFVLRILLRSRDRETVTGDLLEEYRETILPVQGRVRAGVWYLRQVMGLMTHSNVSLLRAIAIVTSVAIAGVVGSGVLFVATHRSSSAESVEGANVEFQQLRARFVNQQALLDMNQRQARIDATAAKNPAPLHTVHTVIFDTRGGQRLVNMTVPYWWARKYGHGRNRDLKWLGQLSFLDDTEFDPESIRLSWNEIERHGPGLIADYRHPSGGQFISWVD